MRVTIPWFLFTSDFNLQIQGAHAGSGGQWFGRFKEASHVAGPIELRADETLGA